MYIICSSTTGQSLWWEALADVDFEFALSVFQSTCAEPLLLDSHVSGPDESQKCIVACMERSLASNPRLQALK